MTGAQRPVYPDPGGIGVTCSADYNMFDTAY
jgi:hypothetical protein